MGKLEREVEPGNQSQPHIATVLLLDTSGSMDGANIADLNEGLTSFKEEVLADELASKRVDIAVVTFGEEVRVAHEFSPIDGFDASPLTADGPTPMGEAIQTGIELLERRKQQYKDLGIDYYIPWLFLITDGAPTDMAPGDGPWTSVVKRVRDGEAARKFMFFAIAVDKADTGMLKMIAPPERPPVRLKAGKWAAMFKWFSGSSKKVSASKVGDMVKLDPIDGWGSVVA